MSSVLTQEIDQQIRGYAKRLDREFGEEAYHNVVCDVLERDGMASIRDILVFFRVCIRRGLWQIWRHEGAEHRQVEKYIRGDRADTDKGLIEGRKIQNIRKEWCRSGLHKLIEGNLVYIGKEKRRTCRVCKQIRERVKK